MLSGNAPYKLLTQDEKRKSNEKRKDSSSAPKDKAGPAVIWGIEDSTHGAFYKLSAVIYSPCKYM